MRLLNAMVVIAAVAAEAAAGAQEPPRLAATSDWIVGKETRSCLLRRNFGSGAEAVQLTLRSYEPEGRFQLMASGPLAVAAGSARTVDLAFGDVERLKVAFAAGSDAGVPAILLRPLFSIGPLPPGVADRMRAGRPVALFSQPEVEARVETIGLVDGLEREFILETGRMDEPLAALRECTRELMTELGMTFAEQQALSRVAQPKTSPRRVIEARSFQELLAPGSLRNLQVIVDQAGAVADCRLAGARGPAEEAAACGQVRDRLRFRPALDAGGQPARSYWQAMWIDE